MVADEGVEAMVAEAMDVSDEVWADGEISGAVEENVGGGAEAVVAMYDLLDGVEAKSVQNPQIESWGGPILHCYTQQSSLFAP